MKVYYVINQYKTNRAHCNLFASLEDAQKRFDSLVNYYEIINRTTSKLWENAFSNEIEVRVIGEAKVYLIAEEI